jgi:hypothetical protein
MPFKSDYGAKRTFDSESGWELFDVTMGPDFPHFELRHPQHPTISFWCKRIAREQVEGTTARGAPKYSRTVQVTLMSSRLVSAEQKSLIQDALDAYGMLHDGPIGPLKLTFV